MNDIYSSSAILLAHVLIEMNNRLCAYLAVISLFVFGLLLFRIFGRTPKGLFISSFISYVLLLINILYFFCDLRIPKAVGDLCFAVGIWPSWLIGRYMAELAVWLFGEEWLFESGWDILFAWNLCVVAFIVNTLGIFAIIRLTSYIRRKVLAKKPQVKQAV